MKVALACSHTEDVFQSAVIDGAFAAAREAGIGFCAIQYGILDPAADAPPHPMDLGGLLGALGLDACLVMDGAIRHQASAGRFRDWLATLGGLPTVLINSDQAGRPMVNAENSRAFLGLLEHLHDRHGHRRMVFIAGPAGNADAAERLEAFRAFERRHGIGPAPLIAGNFLYKTAYEGMRAHLAAGPVPQVVVCANDAMAFGAIHALRDSGFSVPQDCAVTGFDNLAPALAEIPRLTTVDLRSAELGRTALSLACRLAARDPELPPVTAIATRLVIRESCGCPGGGGAQAPETLNSQSRLREMRQGFLLDLIHALGLVMEGPGLTAVIDRALGLMDVPEFRLLAFDGRPGAFPAQLQEIYRSCRGQPEPGARGPVGHSALAEIAEPPPSGPREVLPLCIHGIVSGGEMLGLACFRAAPHDRHLLEIFIQNLVGPLGRLRQREEQRRLASELEDMVRQRTANLVQASSEVLRISEAERRRIGAELHDDICQQLAATLMQIRIIQGHAEAGRLQPGELGELRAGVDDILQAVRGFARGLFPAELETLGLPEAIKRLVDRVSRQTGIAVVCRVEVLDGFAPGNPDAALNLFRIIQEALQNVIRHSRASSIGILAERRPDGLRVEIHDNGRGLTPGQPEGLGLRSMRYRALQLSAGLELRSSSEGTGVIIDLPAEP
jgi:signal transduction histidine kinase/DNA-binding LacI/PurR family transcriptional regulator